MTTLREAAQQALEALNLHAEQYPHMVKGYTLDAENALRAALEFDTTTQSAGSPQTAAKPVAWLAQGPEFRQLAFSVSYVPGCHFTPLYARPPRGCSGCGAGVHDTADSMTALYCVKCVDRMEMCDQMSPSYGPPREWQGLTDAEISGIVCSAVRGTLLNRDGGTSLRIARAIEAALRERNA